MKEVYINMNPNEIESEYLNGVYNEIAFSGKLFHNRIYRIKNCSGI